MLVSCCDSLAELHFSCGAWRFLLFHRVLYFTAWRSILSSAATNRRNHLRGFRESDDGRMIAHRNGDLRDMATLLRRQDHMRFKSAQDFLDFFQARLRPAWRVIGVISYWRPVYSTFIDSLLKLGPTESRLPGGLGRYGTVQAAFFNVCPRSAGSDGAGRAFPL